jgi:hypothetical protein
MALQYITENQGFTSDHNMMMSGDPAMLGLSKTLRTFGKATIGSSPAAAAGVRRDGFKGHLDPAHEPSTTMLAPTIRVIHIFAPKIIKTDVANFRSTVQRLTGRPRKESSSTGGRPQRRARTKTVAVTAPYGATAAAVSSPDSSSGFQETVDHHQLLSSCQYNMSAPAACDSRIPTMMAVGMSAADHQQDSSPVRCCNGLETDSYSPTSNSMDSTSFSFYSSVDSRTSVTCSQQDQLQLQQHNNQGSSSMHSPDSDGSSFFSHRQAPYSLNEIPAPFFSGSADFLQCTELNMPMSCCNNSHEEDYTTSDQTTTTMTSAAYAAAAEFTSSSKDMNFMPNLASVLPPLDFNGVAAPTGFSDLDSIFTGLGSTLPDLPMNFPPLTSSSNGLFYDSVFMQPPLCR